MADNFGLKIGVEGEKQFKSALREINQSFKVLGSEMQLVTSQFDKNDNSVKALTSRNTVLNKEIDTQKQKIETLRDALANASESFGENDSRTKNWQIQLNRAQAELNGMEKELGENEKALDGVGDEFQEATKDADKFGGEVEDSGKQATSAKDKFEKLGGILKGIGAAVGTAMAAIGTAAVGAGKALYDSAKETAAAGDEIDKMSQKIGLSRESYQEWDYIMSQSGMDVNKLQVGVKTLTAQMTLATEGNAKASDAFKTLGLSVTDANGNMKSQEQMLNETISALQGMENKTERAALASQLLGKSGTELAPLLNTTAESIEEHRDKAHDLGMIMSEEAVDASVQFTDSMDSLKRSFEGIKNNIIGDLLPGFTQITDGLAGVVSGQEGASEQIKSGTKDMIVALTGTLSQIVDIFMNIVSALAEVAPEIITALVQGITDNLSTIVDAATNIITALLEGIIEVLPILADGALELLLSLSRGIIENLPALLDAAVEVVVALALGISEALPELIPSIVKAVVTMAQGLIDNLPMILDAALQLIIGLAQGLLAALPELIAALPEIITSLVDFLIGAIPQIIDTGIKLLVSLVEALPTIIEAIVEAIPQIIDGIIDGVLGAIPEIIDAGVDLLVSLVENLPKIITTVVAAIPEIVGGLVDAVVGNIDKIIDAGVDLLVSLVENTPKIISEIVKAIPQIVQGLVDAIGKMAWKIVDAGGDLIKGLWQGINDAGAWLWEKISGFFGGIMDNIKSFFGIHSPSTVFADLGKYMGQGLGIGFEDEMDGVAKDMQEAIPSSLNGPDIDINAGLHTALDGAGTAVSIADLGVKLDSIAGLMVQMFPSLLEALDVKVVLNDGTLVGRLAPEIDRQLDSLGRHRRAVPI